MVEVGAGLAAWYGITPERAQEKGLSLVHPDDRAAVLSSWNRAVFSRETWRVSFRMLRGDGQWIWAAAHGEPIYRGCFFDGFIGVTLPVDVAARLLTASDVPLAANR